MIAQAMRKHNTVSIELVAMNVNDIREGDMLLGLASAGVHSNGFSLVRRIVAVAGLSYSSSPAPWDPSAPSAGASLLTPTRIYVRSLLPVLPMIKGLAHITGGGLVENIPRILPPSLSASVDFGSWDMPPVFSSGRRAVSSPAR